MSDWTGANQAHLMAAVNRVQALVEFHLSGEGDAPPAAPESAMDPPPALERLAQAFGLSPFERDVLVLCAGMELSPALAAAVARCGRSAPTFGLALAALPEAFWSAMAPAAPLRYWRLVEMTAGDALTASPLRVDERVLHYLAGVGGVDERLMALVEPAAPSGPLPRSHQDAADAVIRAWNVPAPVPALLCLCGDERAGKRAVAAAACEALGLRLYAARAGDLPSGAAERESTARLWEREAVLGGCALLVEVEDGDGPETARALAAFAERVRAPVMVSAREPVRTSTRTAVRLDVDRPAPQEQRALWHAALGPAAASLNGALDGLVAQFHLGAREIGLAGAQALAEGDEAGLGARLWAACRAQARPRLDDLAERIRGDAGWDDLVLPDDQARTLRDVVTHVRHRTRVYETWGFGRAGARGLGISALFAGPSGTGKTLAAEVVANELGLDLYRIDLSQVVSKYIGETEKNLRRVFDAAEEGGAVLLFDEADALFGKRSEVKDSHDRYANIEVSYLLQRMEAYRGLAVLTTNLKASIDTAFLRRIRFVVNFPFPDAAQRAGIWRRAFPPATPTEGLDAARLARLNVAGGNIRNIALGAAFLAAGDGRAVRMDDVLRAARAEYEKLERVINPGEVAGWGN
ncbi:MAG TPA: ATP-binding protein [Longimicrobium sp.]|uniref:ATP-binding protein n=1 Tax=Longimicrobium sp. TaxID=2029185 RepID=UPI002ED93921